MNSINSEDLEKELLSGAVVYMEGSNFLEKRYYRINNDSIEYSDDNKYWNKSSLTIEELKKYSYIKTN